MNRDKILAIINKRIENKNIVKHMLAVEAFMRALAKELNGDEEKWARAGLIHDLDYTDDVKPAEHGLKMKEILIEENVKMADDILQAVAAHNWSNNGVKPVTKWTGPYFVVIH